MRNKTKIELAEESKTELILCDHIGCKSYGLFENEKGGRFCQSHLLKFYKLELTTNKSEYGDE